MKSTQKHVILSQCDPVSQQWILREDGYNKILQTALHSLELQRSILYMYFVHLHDSIY